MIFTGKKRNLPHRHSYESGNPQPANLKINPKIHPIHPLTNT